MKDFKKLVGKKTDEEITINNYKRLLQESSEDLPAIHLKIGRLYEKLGENDSAITEYTIAAQLYTKVEDTTGAFVSNTLIIQLDSKNRDALANMAYLQFERGVKLSQKEFKKFLEHIDTRKKGQHGVSGSNRRRIPRGKTRRFDAKFDAGRKHLIDIIQGNVEEEEDVDVTFDVERKSLADLLDKEVASEDDEDNESFVPGKLIKTQEELAGETIRVDLTQDHSCDEASVPDTIDPQLKQIPLLAQVSHTDLEQLKRCARIHRVAKNSPIKQEKFPPTSMFILLAGVVDLTIGGHDTQHKASVIPLHVGDFWGEHSLFKQDEQSLLTALPQSLCTILEIPGTMLIPLAKKHTYMLEILKRGYKRKYLTPVLAQMPLFSDLPLADLQPIAEYLIMLDLKKGTAVIIEGERDESVYLIRSGTVDVWTTLIERGELQVVQADQAQLYLATLHAGDVFGEGAFLTNEPRSATVSARTDVQLLKLPARYLTHIIKKYPHVGTLLKQYHQQRVATTLKLIQSSS